jgi:hypothetical protein
MRPDDVRERRRAGRLAAQAAIAAACRRMAEEILGEHPDWLAAYREEMGRWAATAEAPRRKQEERAQAAARAAGGLDTTGDG